MLRRPLPWLLAAEALVLVALAFLGWRLVSDRLTPPSPARAAVPIALATPPRPSRSPAQPTPPVLAVKTPAAGRTSAPGPGLSVAPLFWQSHLTQVNRDESAWEGLEWRVVGAVEAFARAYVDTVVIPAVEDAVRRSAP